MVSGHFAFTRQWGGRGSEPPRQLVQAIDLMELRLVVLSCFDALY